MKKFILELIEVRKNEAVTTSLNVAKIFGKRHDNLLRDIDKLLEASAPQNGGAENNLKDTDRTTLLKIKGMFFESTYKAKDNQIHRMYYMNRDGFSLLVMGFTGEKALEWKIKYIEAFNKMIDLLIERNTIEWKKTRELVKETRHELTDTLKKLEEYNKSQGSKSANMVYVNYTKLVNFIVGIPTRDLATTKQLHLIAVLEDFLIKLLSNEMEANTPRKDIYPKCKEQLMRFKELTLL